MDTVNGTAGNDIINAVPVKADGTPGTTLSTFDKIEGSAGTDTLNIYTDAVGLLNDALPASVSISGVEIVNIFNADGAAAFGDASQFVGVQQLWQIGAEEAVTKLGASTTAGFRGVTDATLDVAGATTAGATFIAGDYEVISAGLTSFEAVKFTGGTAAVVDASRMVGYKDFTFAGNSGDKITKVAADMNLTTAGNLTATAAGYVAPADADTASTLAGTLNITAKGTGYIKCLRFPGSRRAD